METLKLNLNNFKKNGVQFLTDNNLFKEGFYQDGYESILSFKEWIEEHKEHQTILRDTIIRTIELESGMKIDADLVDIFASYRSYEIQIENGGYNDGDQAVSIHFMKKERVPSSDSYRTGCYANYVREIITRNIKREEELSEYNTYLKLKSKYEKQ